MKRRQKLLGREEEAQQRHHDQRKAETDERYYEHARTGNRHKDHHFFNHPQESVGLVLCLFASNTASLIGSTVLGNLPANAFQVGKGMGIFDINFPNVCVVLVFSF